MALEFEINTADAAKKLAEIADGLDKVEAATEGLSSAANKIDDTAKSLAGVKPVDESVAQSLDDLVVSAQKTAAAAPALEEFATAEKKAGDGAADVKEAAASLDELAAAGEKTKGVSENVSAVNDAMSKMAQASAGASSSTADIGHAAESAAQSMMSLGQGLFEGATHATGFGGAAQTAAKGISTFAEVGLGLPGILAGVAAALASIDWAKFSEKALEAAGSAERLQRALNGFSNDAKQAPAAMKELKEIADQTGFSMEKLEKGFGKFISVATGSGMSMEGATAAYKSALNAARALGGTVESVNPLLNAMDRWMSTGTMSAGMLGRALMASNIPLSVMGEQFRGLTYHATLSSDAFNKLIVGMANLKAPALTLQEEMGRVANSWREVTAAFGEGQMASEVNSMKYLADALHHSESEMMALYHAAGYLYGALVSLFNYIEGGIINALTVVIDYMSRVGDVFKQAWGTLGADLAPVADVFSDIGKVLQIVWWAVKQLASELGDDLLIILKFVVIAFHEFMEDCKILGEGIGILIGLIAGGLVVAWNKFIEVMKPVIDLIKRFMDLIGYTGVITNAVAEQQKLADSYNQTAQAAGEAAKKKNDATDAAKINSAQAQIAANDQARLAKSYRETADAVAKIGTAANPFREYEPPARIGDQLMKDYFDKYEKQKSGSGKSDPLSKYDQYKYPTHDDPVRNYYEKGQGSYYDMLHQMGYTDKQITTTGTGVFDKSTPREPNQTGIGPQQQFGNPSGGNTPSPAEIPGQLTENDWKFGQTQDAQLQGLKDLLNPANINAGYQQSAEALRVADLNLENSVEKMDGTIKDSEKATRDAIEQSQNQQLSEADMAAGLMAIPDALNAPLLDMSAQLDKAAGKIDEMTGEMKNLDTAVQNQTVATEAETVAAWENKYAEDMNSRATEANTEANYVDAMSGGQNGSTDPSGNSGGGGGGGQDQSGSAAPPQDQTYMDTGGVVGRWGGRLGPSVPMSAWDNAPHFAGGGTTGGIPIIAHDNEAVIPLSGGAVPVTLGGGLVQGMRDVQETIRQVGTLAHDDAEKIISLLTRIDLDVDRVVTAINTQASSHQVTATSTHYIASKMSGVAGDGMGISGGGGGEGGGISIKRGFYGTSNLGGYLPATSTNMYQSGGQFYDANGKQIPFAGAADGLENTNFLRGMNAGGVPVNVHPDEAIVNLDGGGRIPVTFPGGKSPFGGGGDFTGRGGGIHMPIYVNIHARDAKSFGSEHTKNQINQAIGSNIKQALRVLGEINEIDDPTIRVSGIRGGPIV